MRPWLAMLGLLLACACGGSTPNVGAPRGRSAVAPSSSAPTPRLAAPHAAELPPEATVSAAAAPTLRAGEPAAAPADRAAHPPGEPSRSPTQTGGAEWPRGVQTAIAVAEPRGPKPPPDQIEPRALAADPESQAGKHVVLVGQVARVLARDGQRWVELLAQPVGEPTIQTVDLLLAEGAAPVQPEECYRVVGVAAGRDDLGRAFTGSTRDLPLVLATEVSAAAVGPYGIGCAPP
jgi:hypothetical protein